MINRLENWNTSFLVHFFLFPWILQVTTGLQLKLCDYDTARIIRSKMEGAYGTVPFLAPEVFSSKIFGASVDGIMTFWTLETNTNQSTWNLKKKFMHLESQLGHSSCVLFHTTKWSLIASQISWLEEGGPQPFQKTISFAHSSSSAGTKNPASVHLSKRFWRL